MTRRLTLGVEEEFFAVDAVTRALSADGGPIIEAAGGQVDGYPSYAEELRSCMLESRTSPCQGLDQLRAEIIQLRQGLVRAAAETGHAIVAAGTQPLADWRTQPFNAKPRYRKVSELYARIAGEHLICGCHVHVGIGDRDVAVQVMNRVRPWLPILLALSSSSPFWMGEGTGYASYRSMVWARWPSAGIPPLFDTYAAYRRKVDALVEAGVAVDSGQAFWDVRPGTTHPTLEFRIADSCTTVDETIVQAGLCRALVRVSLDELADGKPATDVGPELLRAAKWRASRYALEDCLLDPFSAARVPALDVVDQLLAHVRSALEEAGDWAMVTTLVERVTSGGSSAHRQRAAFAERSRLVDVVDRLVGETALV